MFSFDGLHPPHSHRCQVIYVTPTDFAACVWVMFRVFLNVLKSISPCPFELNFGKQKSYKLAEFYLYTWYGGTYTEKLFSSFIAFGFNDRGYIYLLPLHQSQASIQLLFIMLLLRIYCVNRITKYLLW